MTIKLLFISFDRAFKWFIRSKTLPVPIPVHKPKMVDLSEVEISALAVDSITRVKAHANFKRDYKHVTYAERKELGLLNNK